MFVIFQQDCLVGGFIKEDFGDTEAEHILENATLKNNLSPWSWFPDCSHCIYVSLFVPKSFWYLVYLDTLIWF